MARKRLDLVERQKSENRARYEGFSAINGTHTYKRKVVDGYVDYNVRRRHGGEVFYFNFQLAKEIGLLASDHPLALNKELIDTLLNTFSIQIINEYDLEHRTRIPKKDIKSNKYMATRYLQLQHPDKRGLSSGDGRSIWNGCFKGKNAIWDISSCGTGATSLSPATSIEGKYFKTGDEVVCYGCGRAEPIEGLKASVISEIFHHSGLKTERTLAIIRYRDGTSVNVRAAKNLLRPAHIFRYLKQHNYKGLKSIVDYYIQREIANKTWPRHLSKKEYYPYLLQQVTETFAGLVAKFESEYIFCWLDWDGDNIMMDGGVIDYGSIRQFGLFHSEYRYDDYHRMSTTISGQKNQAKYVVQTFAQAVDFLLTGKKKPIKRFRNHRSAKDFDRIFKECKEKQLLYRIGFDSPQIKILYKITAIKRTLNDFMKVFSYFERVQSSKGVYEVTDGVCSDAVFSMRDLLRELPMRYLQGDKFVGYDDFIEILKSEYAQDNDVRLYPSRKRKIWLYQLYYKQLIRLSAKYTGKSEKKILRNISERSALINRYARVTGDAFIELADKMLKVSKKFGVNGMVRIFRNFIEAEILVPEYFEKNDMNPVPLRKPKAKKALKSMMKIVKDSRSGI